MYLEQLRAPGQMTLEEMEVLLKLRRYIEASSSNGRLLRSISWLIHWPVTFEFDHDLDHLCRGKGFKTDIKSFERVIDERLVLSARIVVTNTRPLS